MSNNKIGKKSVKPEKATNQKAAASILRKEMDLDAGRSATLVQRARNEGCEAFDQRGCVDMPLLRKWIAENKDLLSVAAPLSLKDKKLNEEIRKLKILNDTKEKLVMNKARALSLLEECIASCRIIEEQKLVNEWPMIVAGMEPAQVRIYARNLLDLLDTERQKLATRWDVL